VIDLRDVWEDRARRMGSTLGGVLFKGFTPQANSMLHEWHVRLVREILAPHISDESVVVDLGCGYGRLSGILASHRPDLFIVGQDISSSYCHSFSEGGLAVVQANLAQLPFRSSSLGGALAVTSLMYVNREQAQDVLLGIHDLLESGAPLLLIDPGEELRALIGRFGGCRVASSTGGRGFRRLEYQQLAQAAGFELICAGGNPRDSLIFALSFGGRIGWQLARRLIRRDGISGGYSMLALHRWMLLKKSVATLRGAT